MIRNIFGWFCITCGILALVLIGAAEASSSPLWQAMASCSATEPFALTASSLPGGATALFAEVNDLVVAASKKTATVDAYPIFAPGTPQVSIDYSIEYNCNLTSLIGDFANGPDAPHLLINGGAYANNSLLAAIAAPYDDPAGAGGSTPTGYQQFPCTYGELTPQQRNTIFSSGCLTRSFDFEQGGSSAYVFSTGACNLFFGPYQTNYGGQSCFNRFGNVAAFVCPDGLVSENIFTECQTF